MWQLDYRPQRGREPLRLVLGAYLGIAAERVTLVNGEHGRPALADGHDPSLGFNWSHSGSHALIAVARRITPGIDLEQMRARPRALESPDDILVPARDGPDGAAGQARDTAFLELWTAKEAVLKALGRGLAFGLDRLSVASTADQLILQRLEGDDVDAWQLQRLAVDTTLVAALAWRGDARRIRLGTLASSD